MTVSNKRIDTAHGYCFGNLDTMDFRLITDIGFKRNCLQMVIGRYAPSLDSIPVTGSPRRVLAPISPLALMAHPLGALI